MGIYKSMTECPICGVILNYSYNYILILEEKKIQVIIETDNSKISN